MTDLSVRDIKYLLPSFMMPVVILLLSWLSPMGVTEETYYEMTLWGVGYIPLGVVLRIADRRRAAEGSVVVLTALQAIPVWLWVLFAAGHGVILGALLALALQMDFTLMMIGGAVVAAPVGLFLHKGLPGRTENRNDIAR